MTEIIGSGLAFPLQVDRRGGIALARDEQDIDQAIELILGTAPGERPMRPEFGCDAHLLVFSGADATTAGRLADAVRRALDRWEPRIAVEDVLVTGDPERRDRLLVSVRYVVKRTNDVRNLVHPFYTLPMGGRP